MIENKLFAWRLPCSRTSAGSAERARFLPAVCSVEKQCVKHPLAGNKPDAYLEHQRPCLGKRAKYA